MLSPEMLHKLLYGMYLNSHQIYQLKRLRNIISMGVMQLRRVPHRQSLFPSIFVCPIEAWALARELPVLSSSPHNYSFQESEGVISQQCTRLPQPLSLQGKNVQWEVPVLFFMEKLPVYGNHRKHSLKRINLKI